MTVQSARIKLCAVGCGAITEQLYLPALSKIASCELVSLIDLDLSRASALAERYGVAHCGRTVSDIPPAAEAAIVALPNYLHHPVSCELMRRGLHVLCEKPMATTKADAEDMVRCASENNVCLNIGNIRRFYWASRQVKEIMDSGAFGDLVSFRIHEGYIHNWPTVSGFYFDKKKAGGGVLTDIGAHVLDLLLWWLQDYPSEIKYQDDNFGGVEAECYVELRFGTSISGSIRLSRLMHLQNEYTLTFQHGSVTFYPYDSGGLCNAITVNRNGKQTLLKATKMTGVFDYFTQQVGSFLRYIKTGESSVIAAESIIPSIRLIEECYQTAARLELPWSHIKEPPTIVTRGKVKKKEIQHLKILITGASGFIGGRVAERLYFDYGNIPHCLVQSYVKLLRLARFPTEIVLGNVLDYESLLQATAECDVVIHCAYGNTENEELNNKINIIGTENLIRAVLERRVRKFIYLSSIEVYGKDQPAVVDEQTETKRSVRDYGNSKLEAERLCLKYFREKNLPVVILRLALVYGPYNPIWTVAVVRRLLSRGFCVNEQFNGLCNPVYIDDCVDGILLAMTNDNAVGETFIISGGERCTWNEYFTKYNEILGMPPLESAGNMQLRLYRLLRKVFDVAYNYYRPKYGRDMLFTYNWLRERRQIPNLKALLQKGSLLETLDIFSRPAYYSIEKAKRELGFEPGYTFDRGMELMRQYLLHMSRTR
jgi:predicted dehydrogenase/nucleoside-diphosphate-sugar epimerase